MTIFGMNLVETIFFFTVATMAVVAITAICGGAVETARFIGRQLRRRRTARINRLVAHYGDESAASPLGVTRNSE